MNIEVPVTHIDNLLKQLAKKFEVNLDKAGFLTMEAGINGVDLRYLRDKLHGQVKVKIENGENMISLRLEKLNKIAESLEFDGFVDFQNSLKINPQLLEYEGTYYSYLRKNVSQGSILQSPVKIEKRGNKVVFILSGPDRAYRGSLELERDCLFCLLRAEGKSFYHIYKVGVMRGPMVIQGVFAGVTSGGIPIAGRCVLIKQDQEFGSLDNEELMVSELVKSENLQDQKLSRYFENQSENNLMAGKTVGFDIHDLDN